MTERNYDSLVNIVNFLIILRAVGMVDLTKLEKFLFEKFINIAYDNTTYNPDITPFCDKKLEKADRNKLELFINKVLESEKEDNYIKFLANVFNAALCDPDIDSSSVKKIFNFYFNDSNESIEDQQEWRESLSAALNAIPVDFEQDNESKIDSPYNEMDIYLRLAELRKTTLCDVFYEKYCLFTKAAFNVRDSLTIDRSLQLQTECGKLPSLFSLASNSLLNRIDVNERNLFIQKEILGYEQDDYINFLINIFSTASRRRYEFASSFVHDIFYLHYDHKSKEATDQQKWIESLSDTLRNIVDKIRLKPAYNESHYLALMHLMVFIIEKHHNIDSNLEDYAVYLLESIIDACCSKAQFDKKKFLNIQSHLHCTINQLSINSATKKQNLLKGKIFNSLKDQVKEHVTQKNIDENKLNFLFNLFGCQFREQIQALASKIKNTNPDTASFLDDLIEKQNAIIKSINDNVDIESIKRQADHCLMNAGDDCGKTLIHLATEARNDHYTEIIKFLLKSGANPDIKDKYKYAPLHRAAAKNHPQIVELLIKNYADPNIKNENGKAPLHLAAEYGHADVIILLLENRADPNIQDKDGYTPLHWAATNDCIQAVELLIRNRVDPNIQDKDGYTPLHRAAVNGYFQTVKFLLKNGVNPNIQDENGKAPLHLAAEYDHADIIMLLLENRVDPNIQDKDGYTPLHRAAVNGYFQTVKFLLKNGANPNIQDKDGYTPLHREAANGCIQAVEFLLKNGADPNIQNEYRRTPLHLAAANGCTQAVELLIKDGADPNIQDEYGSIPLFLAAANGRTQTVKFFIKNGADPNIQDEYRRTTLLHLAAMKGHTDVIKYSLIVGAKLNIQDENGYTPLHWAVVNGSTETVELLINRNARLDIQDRNSNTPLDLVYSEKCKPYNFTDQEKYARYTEIQKLLQKKVNSCLAKTRVENHHKKLLHCYCSIL